MRARAMRFIACPSRSCEAPTSWSIGVDAGIHAGLTHRSGRSPPISSCQFIERGGILSQHLVTIGDLFCRVFLEHAPVLLLFQGGNRNAYERGGGQGKDQNDVRHDGFPRLLSMAVCRRAPLAENLTWGRRAPQPYACGRYREIADTAVWQ